MTTTKEIKRNPIFLTAPIQAQTEGDNRGRVKITAYNGAPMDTWYGKVVFDIAGMQFNAKMPVLKEHMRDKIFGYADKMIADDGSFIIEAIPSKKTEAAREILDTLDEGFPWMSSIGIWPEKVIMLEDEKTSMMVNGRTFTGPGEVWSASFVGETSIVVLGRDNTTSVVRLSKGTDEISIVPEIRGQKEEQMVLTLEELQKQAPELLARVKKEAADEAKKETKAEVEKQTAELMAADKARITGILGIPGMSAELKQKAIADGKDVDGAKALAWEAEQEARAKGLQNMTQTPAPIPATPAPATMPGGKIDFMVAVEDHMRIEKCKRGEAIMAVRGKNPEAHAEWIRANQKTTFINGRAKL